MAGLIGLLDPLAPLLVSCCNREKQTDGQALPQM